MLSQFLKSFFGGIGRIFFDTLSRSGVTPNQITCAGFALVLMNCGLYLFHHDAYVLGTGLALSYCFDALDGAVARRQGTVSKFGGYLDAVVDRYQEIAAYLVLAFVNDWWPVTFLLSFGCMLISYNKAAVAIEIPIDDKGWPDLMERTRRTWIFCAALMLDQTIPVPAAWGGSFAYLVLWYLVAATHFTALQRFLRAKRMLSAADAAVAR
jgi:phosphatidylglycerophosphate synthase